MPSDFEQLLREVLGESADRLSQFQSDQKKRLQSKLQELVREALKDELTKLHAEIVELRSRVATLEAERAQVAAESIEPSF
jgi:predicted nuclease with TOPRIM domain